MIALDSTYLGSEGFDPYAYKVFTNVFKDFDLYLCSSFSKKQVSSQELLKIDYVMSHFLLKLVCSVKANKI